MRKEKEIFLFFPFYLCIEGNDSLCTRSFMTGYLVKSFDEWCLYLGNIWWQSFGVWFVIFSRVFGLDCFNGDSMHLFIRVVFIRSLVFIIIWLVSWSTELFFLRIIACFFLLGTNSKMVFSWFICTERYLEILMWIGEDIIANQMLSAIVLFFAYRYKILYGSREKQQISAAISGAYAAT